MTVDFSPDLICDISVPRERWIPAHWKHTSTELLTDAQVGCFSEQSAHSALPSNAKSSPNILLCCSLERDILAANTRSLLEECVCCNNLKCVVLLLCQLNNNKKRQRTQEKPKLQHRPNKNTHTRTQTHNNCCCCTKNERATKKKQRDREGCCWCCLITSLIWISGLVECGVWFIPTAGGGGGCGCGCVWCVWWCVVWSSE